MTEHERNLIRDAMMFAVKDITGRVLREATVQIMIDDFEKQLTIPVVVQPFYCERQTNFSKQCTTECDYCKSIRDI